MDDFEKTLWDVYEGRATFEDLMRKDRERKHFRNLAASIMRRWNLPAWVGLEDVEQDLLVAAWKKLWDYEPGRGVTITGFLVYNAYDKAKKSAHKARGSIRSGNKADSNPSRAERCLSSFVRPGDEEDAGRWAEERTAQPARQEERVARAKILEGLAASAVERFVLRAAEQGDYLAELLAGDDHAVAECAERLIESKLTGDCARREAVGAVVDAVSAVARRMVERAA